MSRTLTASRTTLKKAVRSYINLGWPTFLKGVGESLTCADCIIEHVSSESRASCDCLVCHGPYSATLDVKRADEMAHIAPYSMASVLTGSISGLVVIEIAPPAGVRYAGTLERAGLLPETLTALTGHGGGMLFYKHPDVPVKSMANRLGPGVHVHADGGQVSLPPAANYNTGIQMRWTHGSPDQPIAPLHPRLLAALVAESSRP